MNWLLWNRARLMEGEGGTGGDGGGGSQTLLGGSGAGDGGGGAPPPAATASWVKDDGTFSEGWLDRLPDGLKGNAALQVMPSLADLAKSYIETKSMVGKKLEAPGEGATPEQLAAWRKVNGTPDTPEGYLGDAKTLRPDSVPEELWDAENEKGFLAIAHKHHLNSAAVKDILGYYGQSMTKGLEQNKAAETAHLAGETTKLKQAWGNEFDLNLGHAAKAAKVAGLDPETNPIFANSDVVQAFAKLGRMFGETPLVKGESASASGSITARINEIQDPKSQAMISREYRGEFGAERQTSAQQVLQSLIKAKSETK